MASRKASGIASLRPLAGKGPGATSRLGLMASKRTYAAQMPVRNSASSGHEWKFSLHVAAHAHTWCAFYLSG